MSLDYLFNAGRLVDRASGCEYDLYVDSEDISGVTWLEAMHYPTKHHHNAELARVISNLTLLKSGGVDMTQTIDDSINRICNVIKGDVEVFWQVPTHTDMQHIVDLADPSLNLKADGYWVVLNGDIYCNTSVQATDKYYSGGERALRMVHREYVVYPDFE